MPIRLLVAEQCNTCLYGIEALLKTAPDFALLATTRDGEAAVQLALSLRPDILLLDTDLHPINGMTVLARVHYTEPRIRGVFFTERDGEKWKQGGLDAGAMAWVHKSAEVTTLLGVLRDVHAGRKPPDSTRPHPGHWHGREVAPLSRREEDVLRNAVQGLTSKEIGARIGCRPRTVDKHLESIRRKFGVAFPRAIIPIGLAYLRYLDLSAEDPGAPPGAGPGPRTDTPGADGAGDGDSRPGPEDRPRG